MRIGGPGYAGWFDIPEQRPIRLAIVPIPEYERDILHPLRVNKVEVVDSDLLVEWERWFWESVKKRPEEGRVDG